MRREPTVPLKEHLRALRDADGRHRDALRAADLEAVDKALASASRLSEAHNDLLRKMEKQTETFSTRQEVDRRVGRIENWQARVTGGLFLVGAIGITNLAKLWFG